MMTAKYSFFKAKLKYPIFNYPMKESLKMGKDTILSNVRILMNKNN